MRHKFVIPYQMPNLNDYLAAERVNIRTGGGRFTTKGNSMKKEWQKVVVVCVRKHLRNLKIQNPVVIHYTFFEPNKKRDLDNIASFAMKIIQDGLVQAGTLKNDGWSNIKGFTHKFMVDKKKPRIEVVLEEIE